MPSRFTFLNETIHFCLDTEAKIINSERRRNKIRAEKQIRNGKKSLRKISAERHS